MKPVGGLIEDLDPAGLASRIGLRRGDRIVAVNGHAIHDVLDYGFYIREAGVILEVCDNATGEIRKIELNKDEDDDLGIRFSEATFDGLRRCQNRCLFCFVDQMPPGMRPTLYAKDDDYRHSFWHGNFITLTNLSEEDFQRLLLLRLSPLYISVQATDAEVRQRLLRHRRAGEIMERLRRLAEARIQVHTQIVCCPGLNDGVVLEKSLADLWSLGYGLASVAVVPVGLTSHREGLFPLRPFTADEAETVVHQVGAWQARALAERGESVFFAADEFYLLAGLPFPPAEVYEDFAQLENGVGLCRLFWEDWQEAAERSGGAVEGNSLSGESLPGRDSQGGESSSEGRTFIITGLSGQRFLDNLLTDARERYDIKSKTGGIRLVGVPNKFFGPTVTVAGLLTARDVIDSLRSLGDPPRKGDRVLLPSVMFRAEGDVTLDDETAEAIAEALGGVTVEVIDTDGGALFAALFPEEKQRGRR
ncbi:conserved hypothetical protein [Heliomicrobium modesticaldum Ice1]|uniref:PDZ domain-containing protein n=1 Tax=Heliobacterium modesticaldum (strain ATCC 51547 / Ice1) TaxID=498761 RepID=B0TFW2_HELMI|nr:DUF512 domain-containing protein [Heliomicrobium modesticaldum]ABZ84542.1 conserved hypothetical protein [Heliomicrobium modesticaldum Ice1]